MIGYIIGFISLGLTALVGLWGLFEYFTNWSKKEGPEWECYLKNNKNHWRKK